MFQFIHFANSFGEMDTISANEMNDRCFCDRRSKEEVTVLLLYRKEEKKQSD